MITQESYISFNALLNDIPEDVEMFRKDVFTCVMEVPTHISVVPGSLGYEDNYILNQSNFLYCNSKPIKNGIALLNPVFIKEYKDNIALLHRFVAEYDKMQLIFNQILESVKEKFNYDMFNAWNFKAITILPYDGEDVCLEEPKQLFCDVMKYICTQLLKMFSIDTLYLLLSDGYFIINKSTDFSKLDIHQIQRELINNIDDSNGLSGDYSGIYNALCGFYIPLTENGYNIGYETLRELSLLQNIADVEMYDCSFTFQNNRKIVFHGIPSCEIDRFMSCENIRAYLEQYHGKAISLKQIF